jgi:predicted NBD/HSP70 family sugar kinase
MISGSAVGAGDLLAILRDGRARTRAELVQLTGLARSTLSMRLDSLLDQEWVIPVEDSVSSGGRPATAFMFNREARVVLAADLGVTHARLAVTDLAATVLAERSADLTIADGPESVLTWLVSQFEELLAEMGRDLSQVCGIGLGLPGPVEHKTGRPVNPPIMPGWNGFDVSGWLQVRIDAPVLVDNDVNIMALGEHWAASTPIEHLIYIKIGTGIGCGIVADGRVHRGARGAAGDIGHVRASTSGDAPLCRCGNVGCLEALAGGAALTTRLRERGVEVSSSRDVAQLVRNGHPEAVQLIRQAGREIGEVLASIVNFFNPEVIVVGGGIGGTGEHLLAGFRSVIYSRSLPLATEHLLIRSSDLGNRAGVVGAAVMVIEELLSSQSVDQSVEA